MGDLAMFVCLCLAADFGLQVYEHHSHRAAGSGEVEEARELPKSFRFYGICCAVAFIAIFIRCVYRCVEQHRPFETLTDMCSIPEMSGGWGNPLMQNQVEFMVLDGA
jgi:hypothetical protein